MERQSVPPLQAHIGIASGEVVAGSWVARTAHDYTVLGNSVNLAARLVAAAAPGKHCFPKACFDRSAAVASASRSENFSLRASMRRSESGG